MVFPEIANDFVIVRSEIFITFCVQSSRKLDIFHIYEQNISLTVKRTQHYYYVKANHLWPCRLIGLER